MPARKRTPRIAAEERTADTIFSVCQRFPDQFQVPFRRCSMDGVKLRCEATRLVTHWHAESTMTGKKSFGISNWASETVLGTYKVKVADFTLQPPETMKILRPRKTSKYTSVPHLKAISGDPYLKISRGPSPPTEIKGVSAGTKIHLSLHS